jgi:hypothetical protein
VREGGRSEEESYEASDDATHRGSMPAVTN